MDKTLKKISTDQYKTLCRCASKNQREIFISKLIFIFISFQIFFEKRTSIMPKICSTNTCFTIVLFSALD